MARAQQVVVRASDVQQLRMAQAVLLPALAKLTLKATAAVLGVGRATVARLQTAFRRYKPEAPLPPRRWGGRRRALLPSEEEQAFLAGWKSPAERGELVVVRPLQGALEEKLGRPVKPSVMYRLLERNRWRKVAPDTRHPKAEPSVQEEWKKNASGKVGDRADARGGARADDSVDVPGRGPFWPDGPNPSLLGSGSAASRGVQRLRAAIHLCLWRRQSRARGVGLDLE